MIEIKVDSWLNFKNILNSKSLRPQWFQASNCIEIYAADGLFAYRVSISQESDVQDFETNYKANWNKQIDFTDPTGIHQFIPSARPTGTLTFFTSEGDNDVSLSFDMGVNDTSITKELTFAEDVYIKDGSIYCENAPFGASFDVEAVHPQAGVVNRFCRKVLIFGTGRFELNSEDKTLVPTGLILRVTLNNSATSPAAFKAVGTLEGFRTNTLL